MKIAIFTDEYFPSTNGIVISILNSTNLLAKKNNKIKIFAPKYKKESKIKQHKNISIERFPSVSLATYKDVKIVFPRISKIKRLVDEFKPDIIHIQTPGSLGIAGLIYAKKFDIPCIGTYNTLVSQQLMYLSPYRLTKLDKFVEMYKAVMYRKRKSGDTGKLLKNKDRYIKKVLSEGFAKKIIWKLTKYIYNQCDLISVPSEAIKRELINHGFTKPIKVISNGILLDKFVPKKRRSAKHIKLLHVGRISYEKNIDIIIKSFNILLKRHPFLTLTIVGDGPALNSLKDMVKKLDMTANIRFTGNMPHNKLCGIYNQHDIFLTASTMETQGLVILEAMACGMPIVGVNRYAIPDLVLHKKNGFIAKPFDIMGISKFVMKLIKNKSLKEEYGKNSIKLAKEHDLYNTVSQLYEAYNELIKDRGNMLK